MMGTAGLATLTPEKPFYFNTWGHLLRVTPQKANTLGELLRALQSCPEESIFWHCEVNPNFSSTPGRGDFLLLRIRHRRDTTSFVATTMAEFVRALAQGSAHSIHHQQNPPSPVRSAGSPTRSFTS